MYPFSVIRRLLFCALALFSVLSLAVSISIVGGLFPGFLGFGLGISVITLAIVLPTLAIDYFKKTSPTTMVAIEFAWSFVLMILWLASARETSVVGLCIGHANLVGNAFCIRYSALAAFSWLSFIILLGWVATLLIVAAKAQSRGNATIWTSSVTAMEFGMGPVPTAPAQKSYMRDISPSEIHKGDEQV